MIISPGYIKAVKDEKLRSKLRESMARTTNPYQVICEQIRLIYDSVYQLPDGEIKEMIEEQLIDAYSMAKKMGKRLGYYGKRYSDKSGHKGSNIVRLQHTKRRKLMRKERPL